MEDKLAKKCPPCIVTTREFDHYKRDCQSYAELMKRNKRLLIDLYIQPGTSHISGFIPEMAGTDSLLRDLTSIMKRFL
jgi:hypothetical protein